MPPISVPVRFPKIRSSAISLTIILWSSIGVMLTFPSVADAQPKAADAEESYQTAYRLFLDRLFDLSSGAFHSYQDEYASSAHAPDAMYYEAASLLGLGQSDEAAALFERFSALYPTHPLTHDATLALGSYYVSAGEYRPAIDRFAQVVEGDATYDLKAKALYWMGEAASADGNLDEALAYYRRSASEYSASTTAPVARYAIGVAEVKRDNYQAASAAFEELARRHPDSPYSKQIGLVLAEIYYELGDYPRAVEELNRRLPSLSGDDKERAVFMLAESFNQLRRSDDAILRYREITEGNPESPHYRAALFGLGWNYQSEGANEWAADEFARVSDGYTDALAEKAKYYEAVNRKLSRDEQAAMSLFREVVASWPAGPYADKAQFELAVTLYQLRQWKQSNDAFKKLVESYPESDLLDEALNHLGGTFIALGDFNGALRAYNRAIERDAASPELRGEIEFQKAWLLFRNEKYSDAAPALIDLYERYESHDKAEDALFWAAESYYQMGRLGPAADLFAEYLEAYPEGRNADAAHYAIGWTYFRRGRYEEAVREFNTFLERYRDDTGFVPYRHDARLRLADAYYALKRYPEAIRIYSRLADEEDEYAMYQLAQALYNSGRTFEATGAFRRLIAEYPDSQWREEAQYSLGYLFFQEQDYDNARRSYRDLIERRPRDPLAAKALYSIGDTYFNAGDLEGAVREYTAVLDRYPNSPFAADAAASIQFALMAIGEEERAVALVDSFARANPNSPVIDELRFKQAEVKLQSGRTDEALAEFQFFVRNANSPTLLPQAYYYLGSIYVDRQSDTEAESYLRQLVDRFPTSARWADAARELGHLYLRRNRNEQALQIFQRVEEKADGDKRTEAQARYGQSLALMNLGRTREAEQLVKRTIDDAPNATESVPALLGLARIYDREGRAQEAATAYRRIVGMSQDESGAEALTLLGEMLLREGEPARAVEELGRLPVLYAGYADWMARGYLAQARAFERLGQRGEAVRIYDLVIEQYPGSSFAQNAAAAKASL